MDESRTAGYNWCCKAWQDMGREELYALLRLRSEVFVVEQDCVYQDLDDKDQAGVHLWLERTDAPASKGGRILACTRLLPAGVSYAGEASIGRVVTAQEVRRDGWGRQLMARSLEELRARWPGVGVHISAQQYLERFYADFGFETQGEPYLEDGIPHIGMTLPPAGK